MLYTLSLLLLQPNTDTNMFMCKAQIVGRGALFVTFFFFVMDQEYKTDTQTRTKKHKDTNTHTHTHTYTITYTYFKDIHKHITTHKTNKHKHTST